MDTVIELFREEWLGLLAIFVVSAVVTFIIR